MNFLNLVIRITILLNTWTIDWMRKATTKPKQSENSFGIRCSKEIAISMWPLIWPTTISALNLLSRNHWKDPCPKIYPKFQSSAGKRSPTSVGASSQFTRPEWTTRAHTTCIWHSKVFGDLPQLKISRTMIIVKEWLNNSKTTYRPSWACPARSGKWRSSLRAIRCWGNNKIFYQSRRRMRTNCGCWSIIYTRERYPSRRCTTFCLQTNQ